VTYEHNETLEEVVVEFNRHSENDIPKPKLEANPFNEKSYSNVIVGKLIGLTNDGKLPLIIYPGQLDSFALQARSAVDLYNHHIGQNIVLMFEDADPLKPIVMGVLRKGKELSLADQPGQVEVDADGERFLISAKEQVVLRCGKASITLTKAGKVLIQGTYVVSRSSGANRIKGGSIQLN
jgi:Domain of unknown function (DUF6484)